MNLDLVLTVIYIISIPVAVSVTFDKLYTKNRVAYTSILFSTFMLWLNAALPVQNWYMLHSVCLVWFMIYILHATATSDSRSRVI